MSYFTKPFNRTAVLIIKIYVKMLVLILSVPFVKEFLIFVNVS